MSDLSKFKGAKFRIGYEAVALLENIKNTMGMNNVSNRDILQACVLFTALNYDKIKKDGLTNE